MLNRRLSEIERWSDCSVLLRNIRFYGTDSAFSFDTVAECIYIFMNLVTIKRYYCAYKFIYLWFI
jgi:hypothetical protein